MFYCLFYRPLKELTTTMTMVFTGRLQFTGKKVGSTPAKRGFGLFTLDQRLNTPVLRCINKHCTPWNLTIIK